MQAYDMHRNATIFPRPLEILPERWFNETAEMKNAFIPFSYGPRNCVGMNLAWSEIRIVLGTLIRRFEILPHSATTALTMNPVEHFFVVPKAMGLLFTYSPPFCSDRYNQNASLASANWKNDIVHPLKADVRMV